MLSVKLKNILFKNPILTASGTFGYGNEIGEFIDIEKLGGVVTKSVTLHPREGNPQPRITETDSGMLNSIGLANLGVQDYCNSKLPYLNELDTNFIINVAGYAIAMDMVVRGKEDRSFRKSVDTYAVLGPWLVTADEIDDPGKLDFVLTIENQIRQKNNTRNLILNLQGQIVWASKFYTLHPGDIIMSGTCAGVGPVKPGDVMQLEFQDIGAMDVPVRAHAVY